MAKGPANGNRVRRTDTGETAWYVQEHQKGAHSVVPEAGPMAAVTWEPDTPLEVIPGRAPWRT